jgi:hypothetical protein
VEDEEALRLFAGDSLRSEGYAVEYAADGFEVCKAIRAAASYDLTLQKNLKLTDSKSPDLRLEALAPPRRD